MAVCSVNDRISVVFLDLCVIMCLFMSFIMSVLHPADHNNLMSTIERV